MDYSRTFSLPKKTNQKILVRWTRGYRDIQVQYGKKILFSGSNKDLKNFSCSFKDTNIGEIELFIPQEVKILNLKVDGYHCPENLEHPSKQIKRLSYLFILPAIIHLFAILQQSIVLKDSWENNSLRQNFLLEISFNMIFLLIYLIGIILLQKKRSLGYFINSFAYIICISFLTIVMLIYNPFEALIMLVPICYTYIIARGRKLAYSSWKHEKLKKFQSNEIID